MKPRLALAGIALLLAACDNSSRTAVPTSSSPFLLGPPRAAPTPVTFASVSGVVTTRDGTPLEGVHVNAYGGQAGPGGRTDAAGRYRMDVSLGRSIRVFAVASVPGFTTSYRNAPVSQEARLDFELEPWVFLPIDTPIHGVTASKPGVCDDSGTSGPCEYPATAFAVRPPATGRLVVTLRAPGASLSLWVRTPEGLDSTAPEQVSPWTVRVPVTAGSTFEIFVDNWLNREYEFEIVARLD